MKTNEILCFYHIDQKPAQTKDGIKKIFRFCVMFIFMCFSAVLSLYITQMLRYSEDQATIIYHGFNFLCYFTPIIGAIIADSFFGKFKTILYLSLIYAIGEVILTVGSIGNTENGNEGIEGLPAG